MLKRTRADGGAAVRVRSIEKRGPGGWRQGNLTLSPGKQDGLQDGFIESGPVAFAAQGVFDGGVLLEQGQADFAQHRQIVRRVVFARTALVFVKGGCYKLSKPGDQLTSGDYKGVLGAKPRTVAFWFKNANTPKGQHCNLVRWGKGPAAGLFEIRLQGGAAFAADAFRGSRVAKVSSDRLLDGKWHHFAVALPDSGKLADLVIYIDGKTAEMDLELKRSKAGRRAKRHLENNPLNTTADLPVTIGSEKVSGFFDEVMIWERTLDRGEIARLYKATGGRE